MSDTNNTENALYKEELTSESSTIASIIMAVLDVGFLAALIKELITPSAPFAWTVITVLFCLFLVLSIMQFLYRKLKISISTEAITVAFALEHGTIPFKEIKEYRIDKEPGKAYRGQGTYAKTMDDKRTLIYSSTKSPKIILDLREGKYSRLVFSTRQPEKIATILADRIKGENS